jgi:hypothetical protein
MGLSDAVNDWKDLISNIPTQYYTVFIKKYNFFEFKLYKPWSTVVVSLPFRLSKRKAVQ